MSTTSQKHRNFVSEPMGDKEVQDLAGIGPVLGERLIEKGFDKVNKLHSWIPGSLQSPEGSGTIQPQNFCLLVSPYKAQA